MESFVALNMVPQRTVFGPGELQSLPQLARDSRKVFLVTDKGLSRTGIPQKVLSLLESQGFSVGVFDEITGEPTLNVVDAAANQFRAGDYDTVLGVGGGSSMDTAKAVAGIAESNKPLNEVIGQDTVGLRRYRLILIPTTAGTGSEATPNALFIDEAERTKKALISTHLLPDIALLDPELTVGLPAHITAATGLDALAHCVESWISTNSNAISDSYAFQGIRLIARSLEKAVSTGTDLEARGDMLLGSFFGGLALSIAGTGGVHALSYPLGSRGVPHGVANGLLMPRVLKFNQSSCSDRLAALAHLFNMEAESTQEAASKVVAEVGRLLQVLPVAKTFSEINMDQALIPTLAEESQMHQRLLRNNPCPIEPADAKAIYRQCL